MCKYLCRGYIISFGCTSRSGISGINIIFCLFSFFSFKETTRMIYQHGCTTLYPCEQFSQFLLHSSIVIICIPDDGPSDWSNMNSQSSAICVYWWQSRLTTFFLMLGISFSLFNNFQFSSASSFMIELFEFLLITVAGHMITLWTWDYIIYWKKILVVVLTPLIPVVEIHIHPYYTALSPNSAGEVRNTKRVWWGVFYMNHKISCF